MKAPAVRQEMVGSYEIFRNTLEAKQMIEAGASELELRDLMRRHGGRPLIQVANQKVAEGITTAFEVARVIRPEDALRTCSSCRREVESQYRSCPFCGQILRRSCTACNAPIQDGWERCASCGALADGEPAAPPADPSGTAVGLTAEKTEFAPTYLGSCVRGMACTSGLHEVAAAELELAVSEACQLACRQGRGTSQIHLEVKLEPDGPSVLITDEGPAWGWPADPATMPNFDQLAAGSNTETHAFLIQSAVDESHYERSGGKNRLSLFKRSAGGRREGEG